MSAYTVESVGDEPREWQSGHGGTFLSYTVNLKAEDGQVQHGIEWNRKAESKAPAVGDRVAGDIAPGKFGDKFTMDFEATKELGGGTSSARSSSGGFTESHGPKASKGSWQPESERDPERAARILRQHSQEMAIRTLSIMDAALEAGAAEPWSASNLQKAIREWADFFDADVNAAGQVANQGAGSTNPLPLEQGSQGAHTPAPAPDSQPVTADVQELGEALDTAGLSYAPAREKVALYMGSELSEADRVRAVKQLVDASDFETQGQTLRAMKQRTETWTGNKLPQGDALDGTEDVPF